MNTFSATVRSGNRRGSWWTTAMPSARAWAGPWMLIGSPSSRIVPLSGWWTPARILTSVLLPAPFSPTSAWTSPARRSSETSSSAWVAPEALRDPAQLDARRGGAAARGHGRGRHASRPSCGGVPRAGRPRPSTSRTSMPRVDSAPTMSARRPSSVRTTVDLVGPAERRERRPLPLRVVDDGDDLAGRGDHRALDLRLFVGRVG